MDVSQVVVCLPSPERRCLMREQACGLFTSNALWHSHYSSAIATKTRFPNSGVDEKESAILCQTCQFDIRSAAVPQVSTTCNPQDSFRECLSLYKQRRHVLAKQ